MRLKFVERRGGLGQHTLERRPHAPRRQVHRHPGPDIRTGRFGLLRRHVFDDVCLDGILPDDELFDDGCFDDGCLDDVRFDDGFFEGGCEDDDLFDRCLDDGCFDGGCEDGGCEDDRLFVACHDDVCFDDVRFDDGFFDSRCEDGWCEDDGCFDDELFDDVFLNDRCCGSHSAIGNRQSALFKAGVRHGRCGVGRDRRRFQDGRQKVEGFHRRFFDRRRNRINADRLTREDLLIAGFLREAVELLRQIDVQLAVGDGFRRRAGCRRQFILDEGDNLILDGGGNLILDGGGSRQLFDRFDRRRRFDRLGRPHLDRFDRRCWLDRFGCPRLDWCDRRRRFD